MGEAMPDTLQNCEYFLVEYAPTPLRETRMPIGLFLFAPSGRLVRHGFTEDWRRLRCIDPDADLDLLAALPAHFEQIAHAAGVTGLSPDSADLEGVASDSQAASAGGRLYEQLLRMREDCSGGVQISQPKGVLTADPEGEFRRLFRGHVERLAAAREKRIVRKASSPGSRLWIRTQFSAALRRHELWDSLSRDVPVEEFTAPGDGFRIDFSYRPNGVTKYLHAISLERDWNHSKLLSYTFWRIREKSRAQMTAIVADADSGVLRSQSCRRILAEAYIVLQPLSLIDPFLDTVGRELRSM